MHVLYTCDNCGYPQPYFHGGCDECGSESLTFISDDGYTDKLEQEWQEAKEAEAKKAAILQLTEAQLEQRFEKFFKERIKLLKVETHVEGTGYATSVLTTTKLKDGDVVLSTFESEGEIGSDSKLYGGCY
jgi:hypothetical protein